VYYRIASSPLDFNSAPGIKLVSRSGATLTGSPYIVWSSQGGSHGTLAFRSGSSTGIFINRKLGAVGYWISVPTPEFRAYSRSLMVLAGAPSHLLLAGAGPISGYSKDVVKVSVMDLSTF
jgi:hypothetical protein